MANVNEDTEKYWVLLKENRVRIPEDVWNEWNLNFFPMFVHARQMVEGKDKTGMSVEEAKGVVKYVDGMCKFIIDIKKASDGRCCTSDGTIFLDSAARDLVLHYVSNDLYIIRLILEVYGPCAEPLSADDCSKILYRLRCVKEFIDRLRSETR